MFMRNKKRDLDDILFRERFRVRGDSSQKDIKDVNNYYYLLHEAVESKNDERVENLVNFFNKNFKVDNYDEACIIYSKVSNKSSEKMQNLVDHIEDNKNANINDNVNL